MFIVTTAQAGSIPERLDIDVSLPDGRLARTLHRDELYRELVKIGVRHIIPQDGTQALLTAYVRHLNGSPAAAEGGIVGSKTLGAGS
jgi:hypothetical protein